MATALLAIFVIIFSLIKLTLNDPVGILGVILGTIALVVILLTEAWPLIRRNS